MLLVVALTACTPPDRLPLDLRVMSFNIRYGTAPDGGDAWSFRDDFVADVIKTYRPDVLGVQEALRFQLDELHGLLPGYGEVGVGREDGGEQGEYAAILYDSLKVELVDQETFWLSDTPHEPGSTSWGNDYTRICTRATFMDRVSKRTFAVFNTHWDHVSQESREQSAELIMAVIRHRTRLRRVILTGDLNAGEKNPAFQRLIRQSRNGLVDTFRQLHPTADSVGTFNGFEGRTQGDKIDVVLASKDWTVSGATIDRSQRNGRYPSDHFPVTATIRLP